MKTPDWLEVTGTVLVLATLMVLVWLCAGGGCGPLRGWR